MNVPVPISRFLRTQTFSVSKSGPRELTSISGFQKPSKTEGSGLYVVSWRDNFVQWLAWASWLHQAFDKRAFPEKLTVLFEWPPMDGEMVARVVETVKAWRAEANKVPRIGPQLAELNPMPAVWRPWPADEVHKLERDEAQRRTEVGSKFEHRQEYAWDRFGGHIA